MCRMRLAGYEPLTLIDYPGHVAAIVFTQGCPFSCLYCHNPELIPHTLESKLVELEILAQLKADAAMLDGVCVTGGEPTLHPDLPDFLRRIKDLGLKVKLDTNGVNPRMVERCLSLGVIDFLAMDLKHRFENYREIIGEVPQVAVDNCAETMAMIQDSGVDHEFRTTIYSAIHTPDDILAIAGILKSGETYALQEIRYEKTFNPLLKQVSPFSVDALKAEMLKLYPTLNIIIRQ